MPNPVPPSLLISVDPGYRHGGYSIFQAGKLERVYAYNVGDKAKDPIGELTKLVEGILPLGRIFIDVSKIDRSYLVDNPKPGSVVAIGKGDTSGFQNIHLTRCILVIENQVLNRPDPQMLIKLVEARMVWEQAARQHGFEVYSVRPDMWQKDLCGVPRGTKREDAIRAYVLTARRLLGVVEKNLTPDKAAAYLIGRYFLDKDRHAQLIGSTYYAEYVEKALVAQKARRSKKALTRNAKKRQEAMAL